MISLAPRKVRDRKLGRDINSLAPPSRQFQSPCARRSEPWLEAGPVSDAGAPSIPAAKIELGLFLAIVGLYRCSSLHYFYLWRERYMTQESAPVEGQQHPIKLYLIVWGWLFVLSTCSYLVDYFGLQGYLR